MVRVAVLGAGNHSELNHGPSLRDAAARSPGEVELAAVCDLDLDRARRYASRFGFAASYTDLREMVKREHPDAIVAVTPVAATRSVVGELLSYRIPLMIEKPPGRTPAETRELLDLARRNATPHMISFNRRYLPAAIKAREWLSRRAAAEAPRLIVARMLREHRREKDFVTGTAIHLIDAVLSFMGRPRASVHHRWVTPLGGQSCDARIEFEGGEAAICVIAPDSGLDEETYEIIGPDYSIAIDAGACRLRIHHASLLELAWSPPADSLPHVLHGCVEETDAFLRAVAGRGAYSPTLEDGLVSVETAHELDRPA